MSKRFLIDYEIFIHNSKQYLIYANFDDSHSKRISPRCLSGVDASVDHCISSDTNKLPCPVIHSLEQSRLKVFPLIF